MIQAYSKRLLSPYTGQVQILETDRARALTLDGKRWAVQFAYDQNALEAVHDPQGVRSKLPGYIRVANIEKSVVTRNRIPHFLDSAEIDDHIHELNAHLNDVTLPFPAADIYEYWLLDEKNEEPLALIYSCVKAEEMPNYPHRPEWTATPASVMEVERTPDELKHYTPPVNYQVEQLVAKRAGKRPRASWIKRRDGETHEFPTLLLSEKWDNEGHYQLCQRYLERQAPRLLMLHGLTETDRLRLELASRAQAIEVEQFYPLYPEVADTALIDSIRVEARLRRAADNL